MSAGSAQDLPPALAAVISEYLDHRTVERGTSANTLNSYARDLRRYGVFLASAGVAGLATVPEEHVTGFLAALRDGTDDHRPLAPSSAARALVAARGLHRFAFREGLVPSDVAADVHPPSPPKRLPKALGLDDVLRLLEVFPPDGARARGPKSRPRSHRIPCDTPSPLTYWRGVPTCAWCRSCSDTPR